MIEIKMFSHALNYVQRLFFLKFWFCYKTKHFIEVILMHIGFLAINLHTNVF